jgi:hypothetical protein
MMVTAVSTPPLGGGSEAVKKEKDCGDHFQDCFVSLVHPREDK